MFPSPKTNGKKNTHKSDIEKKDEKLYKLLQKKR